MRYSILLLAGISFVGLSAICTVPVMAQFVQVEPYVDPDPIQPAIGNYQEPLMRALKIHNIQYNINDLQKLLIPLAENEKANKELAEAQLSAMADCNIQNLSLYFNNPEEVWSKLLDAYQSKIKELTIHINSAGLEADIESGNAENVTVAAQSLTRDEERGEAYPYWRVGYQILMDLYNNPENYGSTDGKAKLPLWIDQKYQYTKDVVALLTQIKTHFWIHNTINDVANADLVRLINRFSQTDGVLDTLDYQKNLSQYNELISYLKKRRNYSETAKKIANIDKFPQLPKPLPPVYEIIQPVMEKQENETTEHLVMFPQWPSPWARYIREGLKDRAKNGEMDTFFLPKTIDLRPEVLGWDATKINNRLSVYREKQNDVDTYTKSYETAKQNIENTVASINESLKELEIDETLDLSADVKTLQNKLVELKLAEVQKARSLFEQNAAAIKKENAVSVEATTTESLSVLANLDPSSEEYQQLASQMNAAQGVHDEDLMKDLEKDKNGYAIQSPIATNDAVQNIEAQEAEYALHAKTIIASEKEREQFRQRVIDSLCINGGIK